MNPFKKAKWIWANNSLEVDDYAEFIVNFNVNLKTLKARIACDTSYAFYVNDKLIKFMSCSDFPTLKYVDEFDINLKEGSNQVKIQVWHHGKGTASYIKDTHGCIFEFVDQNSNVIAYSNESTLSRVMNEYQQGYQKLILKHIGFSYLYDNQLSINEYQSSIIVDKGHNFEYRKLSPIVLKDRVNTVINKLDNYILVDQKEETTGFVDLDIDSPIDQKLTIAYGEYINNQHVNRKPQPGIDFSVEIYLKKGNNKVLSPFRRIAGRYLELLYEQDIKVNYIGIRPVIYEHEIVKIDYKDPLINKINEVSIHTLELCMHEHYEDCPWREQALYVLDSRNQMLCGYQVFKGFEYQRHNLLLIAKGRDKENGLLTLTTPCGMNNFPIPFFYLNYIKQVEEYIEYSKDKDILNEVEDVLHRIMNVFISKVEDNGLIHYFKKPFWNFYEWTEENDNDSDISIYGEEKDQYDLIINAAFVYFTGAYNRLFNKNIDVSKTKKAIQEMFYDKDRNVYRLNNKTNKTGQLGNAFACLIGLGNEELVNKLLDSKDMIEASLSTRCFVYDALLENNKKYEKLIIEDIKRRYKKMLDAGATTFWETERGEKDFNNLGSLCHGWSALPIYYFSKILSR